MTLKTLLKTVKLNESNISMVLGLLVLLAVGIAALNYFRSRTGSLGEPGAKTTSTTVPAAQTMALPVEHKVETGEHLWAISEKYYKSGYNWVDIAKENNLVNADRIAGGQVLKIPNVEAKTLTVVEQPAAVATEKITGDSYTVQKGDHLWGISVRAYGDGYQWPRLAEMNSISNPDFIYPEQIIKLPR